MERPDSTAIVVTHNSATLIADCLAALRQAGAVIRVVDNASTDRTAEVVATRFPDAALTVNTVNTGFAAAVNQALPEVDTDVVLLVNPDCVLPASTARALVCTIRAQPHVGVAAPRILGRDGRTATSAHPFETWLTVVASRFGGSLVPRPFRHLFSGPQRRRVHAAAQEYGPPVPVDWVSGACLAVRTELLRRLGGLDEGYFMYYEDEELCWQSWRHGAHVLYVPAVEATHIGGASSEDDPTRVWPHLYASMLRFFARHRRGSYPAVRAAVVLRAALGIGCALLRLPARPAAATRRVRAWRQVLRLAARNRPTPSEGQQPCTS